MHVWILASYAIYTIFIGAFWLRGGRGEEKRLPLGFIAISLVVLIALRLPSVFVNAPFNPDEAQFLDAAMSFRVNMNSWLSADLGSSGPLNGYALMWPFVAGLDTGFAVAHITAAALLAISWLLLLGTLRYAPPSVRAFLGGAVILLFGGAWKPDFLTFAAELLPTALVMFATMTVFHAIEKRAPLAMILAAGVCLGAVPMAKLQGVVIALPVGLMLLAVTIRSQPRPLRAALMLAACAALPSVLVLGPLAAAGGFSDFWDRYIVAGVAYAGGGWGRDPQGHQAFEQVRALATIVRRAGTMTYLSSLALISLVLIVAMLSRPESRLRQSGGFEFLSAPDPLRVILAGLILAAGVAAAASPARAFDHYAYFVVWPATLFAGALWSAASAYAGENVDPRLTRTLGIVLVGANAVVAGLKAKDGMPWLPLSLTDPARTFHAATLLPEADGERGRALVWGWAPEVLVWSGWTPASRDLNTYIHAVPSSLRDYYRSHLMQELRADPPELVVDTVAEGSFALDDPATESVASFPDLAAFLSAGYRLISATSSASTCPRLYASKAFAAALERQYLPLGPNRAPSESGRPEDAGALEACFDGRLLQAAPDGVATLTLGGSPKTVSAVEIVSTPGSFLRLASTRLPLKVVVRARSGDAVTMEKTTVIPPYPSKIVVEAPPGVVADRIDVKVDNGVDMGGRLLQIRVRR